MIGTREKMIEVDYSLQNQKRIELLEGAQFEMGLLRERAGEVGGKSYIDRPPDRQNRHTDIQTNRERPRGGREGAMEGKREGGERGGGGGYLYS